MGIQKKPKKTNHYYTHTYHNNRLKEYKKFELNWTKQF